MRNLEHLDTSVASFLAVCRIDVGFLQVLPGRRRRGMWSLADLCDEVLQLELRKPSSLRTGSWEKRPLSVDQLLYAAADAYAGLRLWQVRM